MGYCVYWQPQSFSDPVYKKATFDIKKVIDPKLVIKEDKEGFSFETPEEGANQSFHISRNNYDQWFVKTSRLPYTHDVMMALIIMVEYGMASNLSSDDDDSSKFLAALNQVKTVFPDFLSYDSQLEYFNKNYCPV